MHAKAEKGKVIDLSGDNELRGSARPLRPGGREGQERRGAEEGDQGAVLHKMGDATIAMVHGEVFATAKVVNKKAEAPAAGRLQLPGRPVQGDRSMSPEELRALPIRQRLTELERTVRSQAERCKENMLLSGTWVQGTFEGIADRLEEILVDLAEKETP